MLSDQNDGDSFENLVCKSDQVSKLINAMSLVISEIDLEEAEEKLANVKKSWKIVENEIAQVVLLVFKKWESVNYNFKIKIDASDFASESPFSLQELFLQKSPEAQRAMKEAKQEMNRVRQEIEDFFAIRTWN